MLGVYINPAGLCRGGEGKVSDWSGRGEEFNAMVAIRSGEGCVCDRSYSRLSSCGSEMTSHRYRKDRSVGVVQAEASREASGGGQWKTWSQAGLARYSCTVLVSPFEWLNLFHRGAASTVCGIDPRRA